MTRLVRPIPDLRERVWGGTRLGPPRRLPIGESWLAGPANPVAAEPGSPDAGLTLGDIAARDGEAFVGTAAFARTGSAFPLLAKLIDPTGWLSVQVHPDDALARRLHGPDAVGKTESWFVVEATDDAELLLGVRDGVPEAAVRAAITAAGEPGAIGRELVAPLLERRQPLTGAAYLVPAGALHAVGPGALVYELQQASDLTYRCEDWGRPNTPERPLHTTESLAAVALDRVPVELAPLPPPQAPAVREPRIACEQFAFDVVRLAPRASLEMTTGGRSLHVVTALEPVVVRAADEAVTLAARETVVVAASTGAYRLEAMPAGGHGHPAGHPGGHPAARVLVGRVP